MNSRILHLGGASTFMPSFIEMIEDDFEIGDHRFILISGMADNKLKYKPNIYLFNHKSILAIKSYYLIVLNILRSDKVILHGLNDPRLMVLLFLLPWVHRKLYWIIWGADLYSKVTDEKTIKWKVLEFFRKPVIKRIGNLVTYIPGDVKNARCWYGAKGKYYECLMYKSNIVKTEVFERNTVYLHPNTGINILLGNSADPANNHIDALDKLKRYANENIRIYTPLSYGVQEYAKKVMDVGMEYFGEKFIPLNEFMEIEEYWELLSRMNIAVFNHKIQQAMGNTITLLGMGKTIYMRSEVTQYYFLKELGLHVKDISELGLEMIDDEKSESNVQRVKEYFSEKNLKQQLSRIFKG